MTHRIFKGWPSQWQPLASLALAVSTLQLTAAENTDVCSDATWRKLVFVKQPVSEGYFYDYQNWTSMDTKVSFLCPL